MAAEGRRPEDLPQGRGSIPTIRCFALHCESQRSRAASLFVRLSRSFTLIMSRVSTFDASPGAAAAITIPCA